MLEPSVWVAIPIYEMDVVSALTEAHDYCFDMNLSATDHLPGESNRFLGNEQDAHTLDEIRDG
jgi:hypothetical protein